MSEISVIIVSWNAREHLRNCLASIRETRGLAVCEIIVVDNASSDGSPEMVNESYPEVKLIRCVRNLGFASANNLGIRQATGTFLALVNSDVIVHRNCFQNLTEFLDDNHDVGFVGPRVIGRDGFVQKTCGRFPTIWNTFCEFFLLGKLLPGLPGFSGFQIQTSGCEPVEVQVLSGCFLVARKAATDQVGILDETFFFYAEDVDWCKRLRDGGWRSIFVPAAQATHFGGGSSENTPLFFSIEMLRANLVYWRKHHGMLGEWAFFILAFLQHATRLIVRSFLKIMLPGSSV